MSKARDRSIYFRDEKWHNKRNDAGRASSIHRTQQQAIDTTRDMLTRESGGKLTVMGLNGRIKSKDTIKPGKDPCPPKDTEH